MIIAQMTCKCDRRFWISNLSYYYKKCLSQYCQYQQRMDLMLLLG